MEITWTNVLANIPQPLRADDAAFGHSRAEVRLWLYHSRDRRYQLQTRLWRGEELIETWTRDYLPQGMSGAHRAYDDAKWRAEQWLQGMPLSQVRPNYHKPQKGAP